MEALALLARVELFSTAPPSVLEAFAAACKQRTLAAGNKLVTKGEMGSSVYVVVSGELKVHDGDLELSVITEGNVVGEFSLLDTEPRSASVTALSPSHLYELTQADFYQIVEPHPEVLMGIIRHIIARIRQQNKKLEQLVQERTLDLSANIEELMAERNRLAELDERKNEIIKIVSHDIRSPINGIASLAKMIKEDREVASNVAQVQEFSGLIHNSAISISNFVNEILDMAKLESGTTELKLEKADIYDLLQHQYSTFEPVTITKGVKLVVEAGRGTSVSVDRTAMGQAFNNLISNAIKFTPKGGTVTLRLKNEDGKAVVDVSDTGIGIPQDALPNLFDKFSRIQRKGTKGEKGTGLGMSIAKQIVDLHQGEITVASAEGKGTTFTIRLPLAA